MAMKKSYIISEIGNNHNGSLEKALALINFSKEANVNYVLYRVVFEIQFYRS